MKKIFLSLILIISSFTGFSQFEVKTNHRPDGITIKYINPIPVVRNVNYEAGLSLQKNTTNNFYTVAITVLFNSSIPNELNGNLLIQTTGNNGISLKPFLNKLINMNGREVATSIYYLNERDINELKLYPIKLISFNVNNEIIALNLTENRDVLIKGFSLLNNNISRVVDTQKQKKTRVNTHVISETDDEFKTIGDFVKNKNKQTGFSSLGSAASTFRGYNTDLGESKYDKDISWNADIDENDVKGSIKRYREARWEEEWGIYRNIGLIGLLLIVIIFIYNLSTRMDKSKKNYEIMETNISHPISKKKPEIAMLPIKPECNSLNTHLDSDLSTLTKKLNPDLIIVKSNPDLSNKDLKKIGFKPSMLFSQAEPYQYPMVKMPKENSYIKFPRLGRSNKLGFTENNFFEALNKYFKSDFKVYNDRHITHKNGCNIYEPDFLLINERENKNIFINIEIDEPYDGNSRVPTHEINRDLYRDLFFINRGYIVIRFTEKQIFEEAKQCCVFISNVIKSIDDDYINSELDSNINISLQNQWDTLQSKKWSLNKYRENYLGITNFNPKSTSHFDFVIKNSELDEKVEAKIVDVPIINRIIDDNKPLRENHPHERDPRIVFDPINHRYYIDNNPDTISVSQLIDKFFPEFDAITAAERLNPNHELYEFTVDERIKIWKERGLESARLGTHLHEQIENFYKLLPYDSDSQEFNYFLRFKERYNTMMPHRTEWRIFDEDYLIAGTIDMMYKKEDGTFYIFDWKRSEKVVTSDGKPKISDPEHFYTKFAFGELGHLTDDSYNRYALQQNMYRHILEKKYGIIISSMNLLILHPAYKSYHLVKLPKMEDEVNYIFETFKSIL